MTVAGSPQQGIAWEPASRRDRPGAEQHWRLQDHEASHLMHCRIRDRSESHLMQQVPGSRDGPALPRRDGWPGG